jgi:hypothetical protein
MTRYRTAQSDFDAAGLRLETTQMGHDFGAITAAAVETQRTEFERARAECVAAVAALRDHYAAAGEEAVDLLRRYLDVVGRLKEIRRRQLHEEVFQAGAVGLDEESERLLELVHDLSAQLGKTYLQAIEAAHAS